MWNVHGLSSIYLSKLTERDVSYVFELWSQSNSVVEISFETMKFSVAALFLLPAFASAFVSTQPRAFVSSLSATAAATKEEDLELTRKVIAQFNDGAPAEEEPVAEPEVDEETSEESE